MTPEQQIRNILEGNVETQQARLNLGNSIIRPTNPIPRNPSFWSQQQPITVASFNSLFANQNEEQNQDSDNNTNPTIG